MNTVQDDTSRKREQLALPLDIGANPYLEEEFIPSHSNLTAFGIVQQWPDWQGPVALLVAPSGSGKSHLAAIWAQNSEAMTVNAQDLSQYILDLPQGSSVLLEDVDQAEIDQTGLFHLLNAIRTAHGSLLITARQGPEDWGLSLPDLISRLRNAMRFEMGPPDDTLLAQILVKLFADRQVMISTHVVNFMLARMERSLSQAGQLVEAIDKASWEMKREITIPLVSDIMRDLANDTL